MIELPAHQGSVRVLGIMRGTRRAEVVVHASWYGTPDGGALDSDLYVPSADAGHLAELVEILSHATPAQHLELAAAIRQAAADIKEDDRG